MKIRYSNSRIPRTCVVCQKPTDNSKIYEDGGFAIRVMVCDKRSDCQSKVVLKETTKKMLRDLQSEVFTVSKEMEKSPK